jgi:hypothetical protein
MAWESGKASSPAACAAMTVQPACLFQFGAGFAQALRLPGGGAQDRRRTDPDPAAAATRLSCRRARSRSSAHSARRMAWESGKASSPAACAAMTVQPACDYHAVELARWRDYLGLPLNVTPRHYPMQNPAPNWRRPPARRRRSRSRRRWPGAPPGRRCRAPRPTARAPSCSTANCSGARTGSASSTGRWRGARRPGTKQISPTLGY